MSDRQRSGLQSTMLGDIPPYPKLPPPAPSLTREDDGEIYFASYTPSDFSTVLAAPHDLPTTCVGHLHLPPGNTPVPAVIFLPGSEGPLDEDRMQAWANWFSANGLASFFIDHYRPRGADDPSAYGMSLLAVSLFDRVADAYSALNAISGHPQIDRGRVALMGLSLGGQTTRFAMDERFRRAYSPDHPGFAAFVDFYGPCTEDLRTRNTNGAPLLSARGTNDACNDLRAIEVMLSSYRAIGVPVRSQIYQNAAHGWDALTKQSLYKDAPYIVGCDTHYDEDGHPYFKDTRLPSAPPVATRAEKIDARIQGLALSAAGLHFGYVNGADPETDTLAKRDLIDFLKEAFEQ